jgi:uncharacterized protein
MNRESLIRRLPDFALAALVAGGTWLGGAQAMAGLPHMIEAVLPGMAAQASPDPGFHGIVRLQLAGFADSRYAPQVLYPVATNPMPGWLSEAIRASRLTPPPPLRGVHAVTPPEPRPVIAICIDDLGEDIAGTDKAMALPKEVALSFLPYAETTPFLAAEAEKRGHMILAHVPMQALDGRDPGPMALKPGMTVDEIAQRLGWNLARVPGAVGVNNHEGSRFTADAALLAPVMAVLRARHLFFLDSRTSGSSVGEAAALRAGVMAGARDVFLDDDQSEAAVKVQLEALAQEARRTGAAIAIGHPHDITLRLLAAWLAQDHGVTLVTLDEAMRAKRETAIAVR